MVAALNDPTHEVCNDVYTVAALTWHFEMSLAEFFRRIRYHKGPSDVMVFRKILWTVVVSPFLNLSQQVQISYSLANQTRQLQKIETTHKKLGGTAPVKPSLPDLTPPPPPQKRVSNVPESPSVGVSAAIINTGGVKSNVPMHRKVCKYHFASSLKVPFPGTDGKLPECTFKDDPLRCPACPHQDFSTWSKSELQQLLIASKSDFHTSTSWTSIYNGMQAAIDKLA